MTNAKVHQEFHDDKEIEEHCSIFNASSTMHF